MLTIAIYSLGAVIGVLALAGGLLALWRLIPRPQSSIDFSDLRIRVAELETAFAGFADQYELSYVRNAAKLGKLRRALAKERGEDIEEPEDEPPPQPAPTLVEQPSKAELRRRAGLGG